MKQKNTTTTKSKQKSIVSIKPQLSITQKKLRNKTDAFFYDTGEVAHIKKANGTDLWLECAGEIDITFQHYKSTERYRNDQRFEFIEFYNVDDKKLSKWSKSGKIIWDNNNWFEVFYQQEGDSNADCVMGDVAYDYDSAIQLLQSYADDPDY